MLRNRDLRPPPHQGGSGFFASRPPGKGSSLFIVRFLIKNSSILIQGVDFGCEAG